MNKLRHPVVGMVIFALLITLCINMYDGLIVGYNILPGDNQTVEINGVSQTTNIAQQFKRLNIIEGVGEITAGVSALKPGSVRFIDILGALGTIGIGAMNVILGLFSLPGEILNITIGIFYRILSNPR